MSMKEDRAREGKKAKYRKMGFGPAMDRGEIDFGDKHPLTKKRLKNFKKKENPMADERFNAGFRAKAKKAGLKDSEIGDTRLKGGGMSAGQAKIAAKAPPPNVFNEKDLAVLREEKAKGRGMGLQDESVKPGKVMKARLGSRVPQVIRPKPTAGGKPLKPKPIKPNKKMGGGMMKKYSKGGGADSGTEGERRSVVGVYTNKIKRFLKDAPSMSKRDFDKITEKTKTYSLANSMKDKDRLTDRDIKKARELVKGKMGGGMMQKPMGYSKGVSVKARGCKLGRTRPTKIT